MKDIIERLQDDEMFIDAIDDAITEIEKLRVKLETQHTALKKISKIPCGCNFGPNHFADCTRKIAEKALADVAGKVDLK